MICEALSEEGLIGGVFEEAADEIGHAGDHFAVRAVEADASCSIAKTVTDGFSHSVEDLKFVTILRDVKTVSNLHNGGDRADIMGTASEVADVMVFENRISEGFEGDIGLGFLGIDAGGPAILLSDNGFVVPVGAFHEADFDGEIVGFRPAEKVIEVFVGISEVGLEDDAEMGVVLKIGVGAETFIDFDGYVFELMGFHIDVEGRAHVYYFFVDRFESFEDILDGVFEISWVNLGVEG